MGAHPYNNYQTSCIIVAHAYFFIESLSSLRLFMDKKIAGRKEIRKNIKNIQAKLKLLGVKSLALFGSASRNKATSGSDIDFHGSVLVY